MILRLSALILNNNNATTRRKKTAEDIKSEIAVEVQNERQRRESSPFSSAYRE
jgi:hypothetical protein